MKTVIELNGMKFRAFHGCLPVERRDGNDFTVDFRCEYDFSASLGSDSLSDTLDYAAVYEIVAEQMARPSCLLEHVAGRILNAVTAAFPAIVHCTVSVSKKNPPVGGPVDESRVTVGI